MQVLSLGALHGVTKPKVGVKSFLQDSADSLIGAVKAAARAAATLAGAEPSAKQGAAQAHRGRRALDGRDGRDGPDDGAYRRHRSPTGGTQALEYVLTSLPRVSPGIVLVQHMPENFTAAFAERLNGLCALEVREARNDDRVLAGVDESMALSRIGHAIQGLAIGETAI
jgi:two-component system, chemotaxis family, protein-glutamate methylesterase/glutaminase